MKSKQQTATEALYRARKDRLNHPDGRFDNAGRWYPSDEEDADGDGTCVRGPSRSWPYSYMLRCRSKEHCGVLIHRALHGHAVPEEVKQLVMQVYGVTFIGDALLMDIEDEIAKLERATYATRLANYDRLAGRLAAFNGAPCARPLQARLEAAVRRAVAA